MFIKHKASLSNFKKTEIISSIFSDHNTMRLEVNYREKTEKSTNTWRLINMILNNQWITEEIKDDIKKHTERQMTVKSRWLRTHGSSKSPSEREVYISTVLTQETRKITNKQPNPTPNAVWLTLEVGQRGFAVMHFKVFCVYFTLRVL